MIRLAKRARVIMVLSCMILLILAALIYVTGGRFNTSNSIPLGLYWITKQPIQKGSYVLFCPTQKPIFQKALARGYIHSGFCPGGFGYMMKRVLATDGDTVSINPFGVWVNNQFVAHSIPHSQDEQGRPLPELHLRQYTLKTAELLLMTDQSELSFDARYFGPINKSQVQAVILPVLIWPLISKRTSQGVNP